jgi:tetratricopeptide (TPR) repeat protein
MNGRIALTYNHIGVSLVSLEGDRVALLQQANEAFEKGQTYVSPEYFPEYYQLLSDNKKLVERLVAQGNKMLEGETAARYEADFDRLFRADQFPEAKKRVLTYLNWTWREFKEPHNYSARAHTLLARVAQQAGDVTLALSHAMSARTILSHYERWDDRQLQQVNHLDQKLFELGQASGYDVTNGLRLYTQYKVEGDRLVTSNPMEAVKSYDAALSYYPHNPLALVNRSIAKLYLKDLDGYGRDLTDALLIYPDDPIALFNRAQIYLDAQCWQDALEDSDAAISLGGEEAAYYVRRAEAYEGLGEKGKAITDYHVALQRSGEEELRKDIEVRIAKLESEVVV